ncbi:hypothetical protein HN018_24805 (plasmid) [Lichenicola cladoniae]|uniref:Uncharacterized protein n=1 Tax=Lichenicola cladoniae TaxID=1484109 RepID=A0A6M8HZ97_9PROT|nr:hypothetical protein [Lichenicola cladoniae]NPD70118.1 hypothetical protein [Acetobacteraceae bacterium]QKE93411.1 hypothetical protein HN018_24805 [Lichenicola cladoniae]
MGRTTRRDLLGAGVGIFTFLTGVDAIAIAKPDAQAVGEAMLPIDSRLSELSDHAVVLRASSREAMIAKAHLLRHEMKVVHVTAGVLETDVRSARGHRVVAARRSDRGIGVMAASRREFLKAGTMSSLVGVAAVVLKRPANADQGADAELISLCSCLDDLQAERVIEMPATDAEARRWRDRSPG